METDEAWAAKIRRTRHIGDFSHWRDHDSYQSAFDRLLRDLKAEESMNAQIRRAQTTDANAITRILRSLGWFAHLNSESVETTEARIARHLESCHSADSHSVYVAQNPTGDVVGYGAVHWMPTLFLPGPEGYVSELFLEEAARGQGVGAKLLEAMKEEAKARGCSRLMVVNMRYRESYERGFYRKCGWEERPDAANFVLRLS